MSLNDHPHRSPGPRGPNAERSAVMRMRIIDATVDCLNHSGFAATTTQHVLETGAISRGAMLHHFPTRADLMIAVAEHCAREQDRLVARRMAEIPDPIDQFLALTEAAWDATRSRTGIAFIEIMLGGRSEAGLEARLSDVVIRLEQRQRAGVWRLGQQIGMTDLAAEVETMSRLHTAAMRGLVLEQLCSRGADGAEACVRLLQDYKRYLTGRLLARDPPRGLANESRPDPKSRSD